ncbi:MAG TPA: carboxypeptidase regulatory-like domain-containing protein [Pyrinomonadaceae bacterium]|nr:carboxypeptidase regulatory-like domain-containing protein [Pyrinomonadaceae bacterium]
MTPHHRIALHRLTSLLALCLLLTATAFAQVTTGDITGRVLDAQGNVVPNATISVRNLSTGLTRSAQTDSEGTYTVTQLPAGTYEVTVEAQGFARAVVKSFDVNVGTRLTQNFDLKPGDLRETVEVHGDATLIETTRSDLGGVVTPVEVQNLPLLNRTFASLSVIMPEARPAGNFDPTKTRVGNIAMNGGDGRQLDVNVDGGDNKDNVVGSLLQNFPYESIQEFQVLQHRWTAESGRAVGGVINVVSKSGSNDFHGSGFFNFRNEALRARDFFERQTTDPKSQFDREEFGGSLGGRIIRDKLFFFGALERFRERQNLLINPALLPQIAAIPGVTAVSEIPTPYNDTLLNIKIDHKLSERQSMFYRYAFQKNDSPNDQFDPSLPSDLTGGNTNNNRLHSFIVNHTYTISASKLNQFSFQFQDFNNAILAVTDNPNLTFPSVQTGANVNVPQQTKQRKFQFRDDFSIQTGNHNLKFGANYIHTQLGGFFLFGANGYQITFFDDPLTIINNLPSSNCPDVDNNPLTQHTCYPSGFASPGAVQSITFSTGDGSTEQDPFHQLALYVQDDFKVTPRLTLNLGLRWDANIRLLVDQTNNRTIRLLQQLNDPRAQAITGDAERLRRRTPSFAEFQPRVGFAFDPRGDGRTVIRGGYGIFYDQIFQNLTLFSLQQTNPTIYQTVLQRTNSAVNTGQLAGFRFGIDPLPAPPATANNTDLEFGAFGRINDPELRDPYVQKFSIGFETRLGDAYTLSSDFVHTLGLHENRVQNINPQIRSICDPSFPGSTPGSPLCVRGASTRYFDPAFVAAGLGAGRLEQINMFTSTNRSLFDSWTTQLRRRTRNMYLSASYVLSSSRAWGGQPVASYSGNGIAVTPEQQFRPEEFGPTRIDERHRLVFSGVFELPYGFQLAPIMQLASARPYSPVAGIDIDGDGRRDVDRICEGVDPRSIVQAIAAGTAIPAAATAAGCRQQEVNNLRSGFIINPDGSIEERSGRFFNVDLRASKGFMFGERFNLKGYANFFNLFNVDNLAYGNRLGLSAPTTSAGFLQPRTLYGPGFGPPVGQPFTLQLGVRVDF